MSTSRFCLPNPHQQIVRLFCDRGSLEGGVKTIIGTKTDFIVFLSGKHCSVFSGKLAMATGHTMLINLRFLYNANHYKLAS
jgi:hypothetical protein